MNENNKGLRIMFGLAELFFGIGFILFFILFILAITVTPMKPYEICIGLGISLGMGIGGIMGGISTLKKEEEDE